MATAMNHIATTMNADDFRAIMPGNRETMPFWQNTLG